MTDATRPNAEKAALRKACLQARRAMTVPDSADARLCEAAFALISERDAQAILLWWPLPGEIDLRPLAERLWSAGRTLYFPRCGRDRRLTFHKADSPAALFPAAFGLLEPSEDAPRWPGNSAGALCLVPALAYAPSGHRLGYGGGYYDRFLAAHPTLYTLGLCRDRELLPTLPRDPWDRPVHTLLTETQRWEVTRS